MKIQNLFLFTALLASTDASARMAIEGIVHCESARSELRIPYLDSETDPWSFDDSATTYISLKLPGREPSLNSGTVISQTISRHLRRNDRPQGPNLFTVKGTNSGEKVGVMIRDKTIDQIMAVDPVRVEIFSRAGESLGEENARCELIPTRD